MILLCLWYFCPEFQERLNSTLVLKFKPKCVSCNNYALFSHGILPSGFEYLEYIVIHCRPQIHSRCVTLRVRLEQEKKPFTELPAESDYICEEKLFECFRWKGKSGWYVKKSQPICRCPSMKLKPQLFRHQSSWLCLHLNRENWTEIHAWKWTLFQRKKRNWFGFGLFRFS